MDLQVYDWYSYDFIPETEEPKDTRQFIINMFGRTLTGQSVCVNVESFPPHFYIESDNPSETKTKIKQKLGSYYSDSIHSMKTVKKKKTFGFTNEQLFTFLQVSFKSLSAYKKCIKVAKELNWIIHEKEIDPILRFMHIQEIPAAGWVTFGDNYEIPEEQRSNCELEYNVNWKNVFPSEFNQKLVNAPFVMASFDIETYSPNGCFPEPENKGCIVFQIATVFKIFNGPETTRHLISLKWDLNEIPGTIITIAKDETDLLLKWRELIIDKNPDTLTGYNILKYDINFLMVRAEKLGILDTFSYLGKLNERKSTLITKTLSSNAYGTNIYKTIDLPGRIIIDIYEVIKKNPAMKFESYKLDFIAGHFLGEGKDPITPGMIFSGWESKSSKELTLIGKYCVQDTLLPQRLMDKLTIFGNAIETANVCWVPISYTFNRGEQIKTLSQFSRTARLNNFVVTKDPNCSYFRVNPKLEETLTEKQLSDYLRETNPECRSCGIVYSEHVYHPFKGAFVLSPICGLYVDPITVLDFMSLYPTTMADNNLCPTVYVNDPKYDNLTGVQYRTVEVFDDNTGKTYYYRFAQNTQGLAVMIIENLLNARIKVQKEMKAEQDPFKKSLLNSKQLAIKVSCNSVYGFFGAIKNGFIPCVPVASSCTALARRNLLFSKKYAEDHGAKCIYGDSVTGWTLISLRNGNNTFNCYIKFLDGPWESYHGTKESFIPDNLEVLTETGFTKVHRVIRHFTRKEIVRIITESGSVDCTEDHSLLLPNGQKVTPKEVSIGTELLHTNGCKRTKIVSITSLGRVTDYVYDLETENHHFAVGNLVVHNTDSVFLKFNTSEISDPIKKREKAKELGEICAAEITKGLRAINPFKENHWTKLQYEKVYGRMILLTKKRYIGNMYEDNMSAKPKRDSKGIVLKRRDNINFLKDLYSGCIDILMDPNRNSRDLSIQESTSFMKTKIEELLSGTVPLEKLTLSKSLRTGYKQDNLPHLAVQQKIRSRNPGSEPRSGDRVNYIFIETSNKKDVQYQKAEDPEYFIEYNLKNPSKPLKLDILYYLEKQIQNPLVDLFKFLDPNLEKIFEKYINDYKIKKAGLQKITLFFKPK